MRCTITFATIAVAAALALGACEIQRTLPQGATQIPARELRLFFSDATVAGTPATMGGPSVAYYAPDGTVRMADGGTGRESGRYRIADDGVMCVRFPRVRSGREMCATFFRDGNRMYRVEADGVVQDFTDTRTPGNPGGL